MKKTFKRAGVAVLSMAMLLSMGAVGLTANAAIDPPVSPAGVAVTLPATPATATYKIYQIAQSTKTNGVYVYSTVNSDFADVLKVEKGILKLTSDDSYVANITSNSADAKNLANQLVNKVNDAALMSGTYSATSRSIQLNSGYYLVVTEVASGIASPILLEVKDTVVNIDTGKASSVTIDKGILDTSDTKNGTASNGDAGVTNAAGKIGDKVNHKIISDIPTYDSNVAAANLSADYVITDTPRGTTIINGTTNVMVNSTSTAYNATISVGIDTDDDNTADVTNLTEGRGNDYTLNIDDTTGVMTITLSKDNVIEYQGKKVIVTYTAVINDTAAISTNATDAPNTNTVTLDYDNEYDGGGTGLNENDKPKDSNNVYTVQIDLTKTFEGDANNQVAGAVFTLSKDTHTTGTDPVWTDIGTFTTTATAGGNQKTWEGLGVGKYQIAETTVPNGFVGSAPAVFEIAATPDNGPTDSIQVFSFTGATTDGSITLNNPKKDTLPGTGGIGTTLFTVGGAAVVLVAGFMFVMYMKKRGTEEE